MLKKFSSEVENLQNLATECSTKSSNDTNSYVNLREFVTRDTDLFTEEHNNVFAPKTLYVETEAGFQPEDYGVNGNHRVERVFFTNLRKV